MRRPFFALGAALLVVALGAGCGATNAADPDDPAAGGRAPGAGVSSGPSGLPCNVDKILADNCRKCHSDPPQFGSPMPLMTWQNLQAAAVSDASKRVYQLVPLKIADDARPMPPPPNARLSAADRKVLADWAAAGAPKSTDTCDAKPPADTTIPLSCTPDITLAPTSPWTMPTDGGDEYVCWGVDLTRPTPTHITAFSPHIDNTKIVHHVVVYEAPTSFPGTPAPCSSGGSLAWRMVLGWAPGTKGFELPPEAGFPIATTGATHYVVQMHYSNPQKLVGEKDASKLDLCTAPPRPNEADVLAFGTQDISIPAQPPAGGVYRTACSITVPDQLLGIKLGGIHLFTAMPHMHRLGVEMKTTLTPSGGGAPLDLGTMATFDFNQQAWLPITATVNKGDVVTTTCGWKNTTGSPVDFGEKTANEMCYSFTMYYPRIKAPLWSWAVPALASTCTTL